MVEFVGLCVDEDVAVGNGRIGELRVQFNLGCNTYVYLKFLSRWQGCALLGGNRETGATSSSLNIWSNVLVTQKAYANNVLVLNSSRVELLAPVVGGGDAQDDGGRGRRLDKDSAGF